jgi:hypothetical protein
VKRLLALLLFLALMSPIFFLGCCKRDEPEVKIPWIFKEALKTCGSIAPKEFRKGDSIDADWLAGCLTIHKYIWENE